MKIIKVKILNNTQAIEVNKMKPPVRSEMGGLKFINELHKFNKKEDSLRKFNIQEGDIPLPINSIEDAELIDKKTVRIIWKS